jgi:uncharacterized membrane protein YfcA
MKKSQLRFEIAAIAGIALFSGIFLVRTYDYNYRAALFPRLVSYTVLILLLYYVFSRVRRYLKERKESTAKEVTPQTEEGAETEERRGMSWVVAFGIAIGFLILIYLTGFAVAAVCYMAAHIYLTGYRNHKIVLLYALFIGIALVSFEYLFDISLPKGILFEMIRGHS